MRGGLEQHDMVAKLGKLAGGGEASKARTDDVNAHTLPLPFMREADARPVRACAIWVI